MGSVFHSLSVGCSRSAQVALNRRRESSESAHAAVTENHSSSEISRQICEWGIGQSEVMEKKKQIKSGESVVFP